MVAFYALDFVRKKSWGGVEMIYMCLKLNKSGFNNSLHFRISCHGACLSMYHTNVHRIYLAVVQSKNFLLIIKDGFP